MLMRHRLESFSLIEVVIAVGIFAVGIVVILSLLPSLIRGQQDTASTQVALQLPSAITTELRRMASGNLTNIGSRLAVMGSAPDSTLRLIAAKDGADLREWRDRESQPREQYFLVELYAFPAGPPLAYDSNAAYVAMSARVSWPYRVKAGADLLDTDPRDRQSVTFNLSLNR